MNPGLAVTLFLVLLCTPNPERTFRPMATMERSGISILAHKPSRIVIARLVRNSGWARTAFNLAIQVWIGFLAESAWGTVRWTLVALRSGIGAKAWVWPVQPVGAGIDDKRIGGIQTQ